MLRDDEEQKTYDYKRERMNFYKKIFFYVLTFELAIQILFGGLALGFKWPVTLWGLLFIAGVGLGIIASLGTIIFFINQMALYLEYSTSYSQMMLEVMHSLLDVDENDENTQNYPPKK